MVRKGVGGVKVCVVREVRDAGVVSMGCVILSTDKRLVRERNGGRLLGYGQL